jgi:hypothetical protein
MTRGIDIYSAEFLDEPVACLPGQWLVSLV